MKTNIQLAKAYAEERFLKSRAAACVDEGISMRATECRYVPKKRGERGRGVSGVSKYWDDWRHEEEEDEDEE